jgi:hypothetical protein
MKPFVEKGHMSVEMNVGEYGLHGDVIVTRVDSLPKGWENWPIVEDNCFAYGEVTGHIHQLSGEDVVVRENPETLERFAFVNGQATIKHQEHGPRSLLGDINTTRIYRHGIQREYDHFTKKIEQVRD